MENLGHRRWFLIQVTSMLSVIKEERSFTLCLKSPWGLGLCTILTVFKNCNLPVLSTGDTQSFPSWYQIRRRERWQCAAQSATEWPCCHTNFGLALRKQFREGRENFKEFLETGVKLFVLAFPITVLCKFFCRWLAHFLITDTDQALACLCRLFSDVFFQKH